jgi:hypothetical protein
MRMCVATLRRLGLLAAAVVSTVVGLAVGFVLIPRNDMFSTAELLVVLGLIVFPLGAGLALAATGGRWWGVLTAEAPVRATLAPTGVRVIHAPQARPPAPAPRRAAGLELPPAPIVFPAVRPERDAPEPVAQAG